jgi:hypothetical protein
VTGQFTDSPGSCVSVHESTGVTRVVGDFPKLLIITVYNRLTRNLTSCQKCPVTSRVPRISEKF